MDVYLLWHIHEMPDGEEDAKLIGVYASAEDAERAKRRVLPQPGFRDLPEGFQVSRYEVGRDHWTEGYVTVTPESLMRQFGGAPEAEQNAAADRPRE
jgi:homoserine kinase type II